MGRTAHSLNIRSYERSIGVTVGTKDAASWRYASQFEFASDENEDSFQFACFYCAALGSTTRLSEQKLKKFYEVASRKFNPIVFKALDAMKDDEDPTAFLFYIIGNTCVDGPIPLKELLIQVYEKLCWITERRGIHVASPISFTREEINEAREQAQAWAAVFNEFEGVRARIAGQDEWVSHEQHDEAIVQFNTHKKHLEELRRRLDHLSGIRRVGIL